MISVDPRTERTAAPTSPACVSLATVFQHELVETPPTTSAPIAVRRHAAALTAQARTACQSCPLAVECLYRAVIDHDVAGYVAGTTERQRNAIRRRLGVRVAPEDLDSLAGVTGGHGPVEHAAVLRLRRSHPDESLEKLARRLGCSLSTVKRHLRQERRRPTPSAEQNRRPSVPAVLAAAADVLTGSAQHIAA